jgi:hypothetical protein
VGPSRSPSLSLSENECGHTLVCCPLPMSFSSPSLSLADTRTHSEHTQTYEG